MTIVTATRHPYPTTLWQKEESPPFSDVSFSDSSPATGGFGIKCHFTTGSFKRAYYCIYNFSLNKTLVNGDTIYRGGWIRYDPSTLNVGGIDYIDRLDFANPFFYSVYLSTNTNYRIYAGADGGGSVSTNSFFVGDFLWHYYEWALFIGNPGSLRFWVDGKLIDIKNGNTSNIIGANVATVSFGGESGAGITIYRSGLMTSINERLPVEQACYGINEGVGILMPTRNIGASGRHAIRRLVDIQ